MSETEKVLFEKLEEQGVTIAEPSWESCRQWLRDHDWKINVLSDYPGGEIKFTVRKGFERIEISGLSDLEVMGKAISEIQRRALINQTLT